MGTQALLADGLGLLVVPLGTSALLTSTLASEPIEALEPAGPVYRTQS
jgi:hypothetical protein